MEIRFDESPPSRDQFRRLFDTTGWNDEYHATSEELARALANSQCTVAAYASDELVGFGRVVSDGVLHAMIYDLIVAPAVKSQGIGSAILRKLVERCLADGIRDIQLFCAEGQSGFYETQGFERRPADAPGMQYRR